MNNKERRDYLFNQAEEAFDLMLKSWTLKNWNMVIRRAQESLECYLKSALKYMSIEFPKEHDIGEYFERILIKRNIQYNEEDLEKIKELSKELVDKRAPAYYGEEFYSMEEAKRAKEGAEFVRIFIRDFVKKLKA